MSVTDGIAVFCGASMPTDPAIAEGARRLGALIAESGRPLVYGGAKVGLMGVVADATLAAGGQVYGVLPRKLLERERAHEGLTKLDIVETMHERKALMYEASAAFVVLPGGFGTLDEAMEILTWKQIGYHAKPVAFWDHGGYYSDLLAWMRKAQDGGLLRAAHAAYLQCAAAIEDVWALALAEATPQGRPMDWA